MFYVGSLGSDLTNPERGVQKVFFVRLSRGSDWRELVYLSCGEWRVWVYLSCGEWREGEWGFPPLVRDIAVLTVASTGSICPL